jgi:hypothetical protein
VRTWEVELGGRVEPEAAPGGEQRPDHLNAAAAAGPGRRARGLALGGRRPGRGPPERHVAQPQAPVPLSGVLLLPPVPVALLLRQDQQRLAVRVGRRKTYGRGRALLGRRAGEAEGEEEEEYDWDGDAERVVRGIVNRGGGGGGGGV